MDILFGYQGAIAKTIEYLSASLLASEKYSIGFIRHLPVHERSTKCVANDRNCEIDNYTFPVAMRPGETPVPIPNTMVKTWAADDTILETVWESRWPPGARL